MISENVCQRPFIFVMLSFARVVEETHPRRHCRVPRGAHCNRNRNANRVNATLNLFQMQKLWFAATARIERYANSYVYLEC